MLSNRAITHSPSLPLRSSERLRVPDADMIASILRFRAIYQDERIADERRSEVLFDNELGDTRRSTVRSGALISVEYMVETAGFSVASAR
jgi:hypothetical protein